MSYKVPSEEQEFGHKDKRETNKGNISTAVVG